MNQLQQRNNNGLSKQSFAKCYYSPNNSLQENSNLYPDPTDKKRKHRIPQIIDDKGNIVGKAIMPRDMLESIYWENHFQGYMTESQLEKIMIFKVIMYDGTKVHGWGLSEEDAARDTAQQFNLPLEWVIDTIKKYRFKKR